MPDLPHCPTCGQVVLPSMGASVARKVEQAKVRPWTAVVQTIQPTDSAPAVTVTVGGSALTPRMEATPRGYKGQMVVTYDGKRYRFRINLIKFPRKGTIGGNITIIDLSQRDNQAVSASQLGLTEYQQGDNSYVWIVQTESLGTCTLSLKLN